MKKTISSFLKIIFAVALVYWLVNSGKIDLKSLYLLLNPQVLLIGILFTASNFILASERWRTLLSSQNVFSSFFESFKLTMIGVFFNFAMPGGVGGDLIKAFYFSKDHKNSKYVAATSVLMDRILGLYVIIIMATVAMCFEYPIIQNNSVLLKLFYFIFFVFVAFTASLFIIFSSRLYSKGLIHFILNKFPFSEKLLKLYESTHLYGKNLKKVFRTFLLSLIAQSFSILLLYYLAFQVEPNSSAIPALSQFFIIAPIGFIATAIPIAPAGVGVGQAAFYFLFKELSGLQNDLGGTIITLFQVFQFLTGLTGAYFYIQRKDKIDEKSLAEM